MEKTFCRLRFARILTCLILLCAPCSLPALAAPGDATEQALQMVLDGDEENAQRTLETAYAGANDPATRVEVAYFLAALASRNHDSKDALRFLNEVKQTCTAERGCDELRQLMITKHQADCHYAEHQLREALNAYKAAFMMASDIPATPNMVREELLESMVAASMDLKNSAEAEKYSQLLIQTVSHRAQTEPLAVFSWLWADLQLADIYKRTGQNEKLAQLQSEVRPLFTRLVDARMAADSSGRLPPYDALIAALRQRYVQELQPRLPADIAWAACDFRERTLPIVAWSDATNKPKAAVICVHGLGLENRAFERTARELNKRGIAVYALDVRGFGSWTQTKGLEDIDYDQTISDIGTVAEALKSRAPGLPVFVLGESMGGAIALRAGARLGKQVDGIISSVPSAERFQQRRMTLQTAFHFIIDPRKAFDVGYVAERATAKETARERWKEDPKAKLRLTPIELADFALFMRRTKHEAAKIKHTPTLVVQGLADRLVKPQGTFELFDAVQSQDKTLYLAGQAEHLMFETSTPDPLLIDCVDAWVNHHISSRL